MDDDAFSVPLPSFSAPAKKPEIKVTEPEIIPVQPEKIMSAASEKPAQQQRPVCMRVLVPLVSSRKYFPAGNAVNCHLPAAALTGCKFFFNL